MSCLVSACLLCMWSPGSQHDGTHTYNTSTLEIGVGRWRVQGHPPFEVWSQFVKNKTTILPRLKVIDKLTGAWHTVVVWSGHCVSSPVPDDLWSQVCPQLLWPVVSSSFPGRCGLALTWVLVSVHATGHMEIGSLGSCVLLGIAMQNERECSPLKPGVGKCADGAVYKKQNVEGCVK